ncbi:MAG: hypothetical protein Q4C22_01975 [Bacillota bacterium]|nr:hypothetical protein [Bacillota bacterium]
MEGPRGLLCRKCNRQLVEKKTEFSYLGNKFSAPMLQCPQCGQVFIPESVVKGRMAEVEAALESK